MYEFNLKCFFLSQSLNMKRINKMRAEFLFKRFQNIPLEMNVCSVINTLFIDEPSLNVTINCEQCNFINRKSYQSIGMNHQTFNNDMKNIGIAVSVNFSIQTICPKCQNSLVSLHEYGQHLFIEVAKAPESELSPKHKLVDIPIAIFNDQYILLAAFLYGPGTIDEDIGHYTVAIKLNENWQLFDDCESKPKEINNQHSAIISALFYVKNENLDSPSDKAKPNKGNPKRKTFSPSQTRSKKQKKT